MKFPRLPAVVLISFGLLLTSIATAVTPAVKITQVKPVLSTSLSGASGDDVSAITSTAQSIILVGTVEGPGGGWVKSAALGSSDGYIAAIDSKGAYLWDRRLGTGLDDIASAVTQDSAGNYWVVGASTISPPIATPTPSASPTVLNPDGVIVDPVPPTQIALSRIELWSVSPQGSLISSYSLDTPWSVHPQTISITGTKVSITGEISSSGKVKRFTVPFTLGGTFGALVQSPNFPTPTNLSAVVGSSTWKSQLSSGSIPGLPSWRPKAPTQVLLRYSKSGKLTDARFIVGTPLGLRWQKEIGLILITERNARFGLTIVSPLAG